MASAVQLEEKMRNTQVGQGSEEIILKTSGNVEYIIDLNWKES